jgi:hypothetical protein
MTPEDYRDLNTSLLNTLNVDQNEVKGRIRQNKISALNARLLNGVMGDLSNGITRGDMVDLGGRVTTEARAIATQRGGKDAEVTAQDTMDAAAKISKGKLGSAKLKVIGEMMTPDATGKSAIQKLSEAALEEDEMGAARGDDYDTRQANSKKAYEAKAKELGIQIDDAQVEEAKKQQQNAPDKPADIPSNSGSPTAGAPAVDIKGLTDAIQSVIASTIGGKMDKILEKIPPPTVVMQAAPGTIMVQ